jgi:hypothetical protein
MLHGWLRCTINEHISSIMLLLLLRLLLRQPHLGSLR